MAALNSSIAPASTEYGGDEIAAIVLDPGYSSVRTGFAGEDVPKSVIPTDFGVLGDRLIYGYDALQAPRAKLEVVNPLDKDGIVENWDSAAKLFEHAITSRLTHTKAGNPKTNGLNDKQNGDNSDEEMADAEEAEKALEENPLLMSEPGWNPVKAREKSIEIAMEKWGCPAFWISKTGVLAAFAAGKATALVVDIGASNISVTPVYEGSVLRKGVQHSPLGGNFVSDQARLLFASASPPIPVTPHYSIISKTPVDAGAPASATYRTLDFTPTDSFRRLHEERVLTEFKEYTVQLFPQRLVPSNQSQIPEEARAGPGRPFEMPDGYNALFGADRYRVAEGMFDAKQALVGEGGQPPLAAHTIPTMIREALQSVEIDVRPQLVSNIVVVGASSLLFGFTDRLQWEIQQLYPTLKVRIHAAGNTSERKFASWLGGSILASLGSFHQMWVSKKEYDEHGANVVERRCK